MILDSLKSQLQRHGLWAKKALGQNFLVDEAALQKIVEAAELKPDDHVIEVGAGTGLLTTRLAERCAHLMALEYDREMISVLQENLRNFKNTAIRNEDALKFQITPRLAGTNYKLVANIPYYITSPLIKHFLMGDRRPSLVVLLIQKEVAEKICGKGGKTVLTIETQVFGEPEIAGIVPAGSFYPSPKVDSAILRIRVFPEPKIAPELMDRFLKVLHAGYSQKRKKLSNSLASRLHITIEQAREILERAGFAENVRPENLSVENWLSLTKIIFSLQ